jgi:hypothetical protein
MGFPIQSDSCYTSVPILVIPLADISSRGSSNHGHETSEESLSPWQPFDNKLSVKTGKFLINKTGLWVNKSKVFSVSGKWAIGPLLRCKTGDGGVHAVWPTLELLQTPKRPRRLSA